MNDVSINSKVLKNQRNAVVESKAQFSNISQVGGGDIGA